MNVSQKINRILTLIGISIFLILIRVWYLSVVKHDYYVQQAYKPQRKIILEKAPRATIYDRFGIPLAVNKLQYNVSVVYAEIRQIPNFRWKKNSNGRRIRIPERKNYIEELSEMLSKELGIDCKKIQDIIQGEASLLPHTPFTIKQDVSEEQYYALKMKEREWVGLQLEKVNRRFYPLGKVGCDIIGYLGAMDPGHYRKIGDELRTLESYLNSKQMNQNPFLPEGFYSTDEVYHRFLELQEKSYKANDLIGKSGVEAVYEEALRGYYGKHLYEVDVKGNCLQKLEGSRNALPGKKLTLTLSAELQDFAEKLLASSEGSCLQDPHLKLNEKWIRGGSIVAMIPQTGEIVALASYPRFDPNDFIPSQDSYLKKEKSLSIQKWLENDLYIGSIWDGKRCLEREYFSFIKGEYIEERLPLTLDVFLEAVVADSGPLKSVLQEIDTLSKAFKIQIEGPSHSFLESIEHREDRLLIVDLCHLIAPHDLFSLELKKALGNVSLNEYFEDRQQTMREIESIRMVIKELFHEYDFVEWRKNHFKDYLKEKRLYEKNHNKYTRPYTDYLDQVEKKLFSAFWETYKNVFVYTLLTGEIPISLEVYPQLYPYFAYLKTDYQSHLKTKDLNIQKRLFQLPIYLGVDYLKTFRSYEELIQPLKGKYEQLRSFKGQQLEKHLASAFYPLYGFGFCRSQAFQQIGAQGSVFKLITSYQTLIERHQDNLPLNPLVIVDDLKGGKGLVSPKQILGSRMDGTPIYRLYKGGMLPRSSHSGMGEIDLIGALEQSSNLYFALLARDFLHYPKNLSDAARLFQFGQKTGIDLLNESSGNIPDDLDQNPTGLYTFSIGQHTLTVTPIQTAVMLGAIANQGIVVQPHLMKTLEGAERKLRYEITSDPSFRLSKAIIEKEEWAKIDYKTNPIRTIPFPAEIHQILIEGMRRSVIGSKGSSRPAIMRSTYDHPNALKTYQDLHEELAAKTGTAQVLYKQSLARSIKPIMKVHVWFTGIEYPKQGSIRPPHLQQPELVVVVFLRFRKAGIEGGPIAAQIIQKWREIQKIHRKSS